MTSRVFPLTVPYRVPLPSIMMKPNLVSSSRSSFSACANSQPLHQLKPKQASWKRRIGETAWRMRWSAWALSKTETHTHTHTHTSTWNLLSQRYNDVLIGLKGSKSIVTCRTQFRACRYQKKNPRETGTVASGSECRMYASQLCREITCFSLPSSVKTVPQYKTKPLFGTLVYSLSLCDMQFIHVTG